MKPSGAPLSCDGRALGITVGVAAVGGVDGRLRIASARRDDHVRQRGSSNQTESSPGKLLLHEDSIVTEPVGR